MSALVPRATIDELSAHRTRSLELYAEAWDLMAQGESAARAAVAGRALYNMPEVKIGHIPPPRDRDDFLAKTRAQVDRAVWNHLLEATGLERLMDRQARDQFRDQLEKDPPEATRENCFATMEQLIGDADTIFKRGIANAFSGLDRRFRSHDGFKVGARVIMDHAFSDCASWNHYRRQDETIRDIERTFCILDGKSQPERMGGIVGVIDAERRGLGLSMHPFEAENEYFRIKAFKNGNAHLWFKRDDLVDRVNLLLAEYYGAALGAGSDVADVKHEPSRAMAKNYGFFETPPDVVERVMEEARIGAGMSVLEPSAGLGAIAKKARSKGGEVTCIEIVGERMSALHRDGFTAFHIDFLNCSPTQYGLFDRIVMNPPFDRGLDVDHVTHAMKFLKPGGRLVSVMSAGVEFREDRKTADFRAMVEPFGGSFRDLPAGSFASSGTMVNTCILTLRAP